MATMRSPTVRRRWVARRLKMLRERAGMTMTAAAKQLGTAQSTLSRIESQELPANPVMVRAALALYGVPTSEAEPIIEVCHEAQQNGWWQGFDDAMPRWFHSYVGLEEDADRIETYQSEFIPGLLQTEDYAREILRVTDGRYDLDRKVELRMKRQQILHRDTPATISAVINEAALHRQVGGAKIMAAQLEHLRRQSELPNITVQVMPFTSGAHRAMTGPYVILTFPDTIDEPVVYLDNFTLGHILEAPGHCSWYHETHQVLKQQALPEEQSRQLIAEISCVFTSDH